MAGRQKKKKNHKRTEMVGKITGRETERDFQRRQRERDGVGSR